MNIVRVMRPAGCARHVTCTQAVTVPVLRWRSRTTRQLEPTPLMVQAEFWNPQTRKARNLDCPTVCDVRLSIKLTQSIVQSITNAATQSRGSINLAAISLIRYLWMAHKQDSLLARTGATGPDSTGAHNDSSCRSSKKLLYELYEPQQPVYLAAKPALEAKCDEFSQRQG